MKNLHLSDIKKKGGGRTQEFLPSNYKRTPIYIVL